ncbi:hypothetical protein SRS16CHR_02086 [Variovorax sp. SRS16]|uniref:hypothetical protein n=1 Tax=Variovorax sp. SRS16 TaxID=282217 RepID=UPI0013188783|nr:hypothetical protein [Variovorax sp. SRS16]VTU17713.1 hypothetical protein SRS16CHR_02086 [Variovorax sp. SRS16]
MSVVCAVCNTENRDNAMFCHGCAGRLPAFAATGPSALAAMRVKGPAGGPDSERPPALERIVLPTEQPIVWIRVGLLAFAVLLCFVGWTAYVTRRAPAPAVVQATAPTAPMPAVAPPKAPDPVPLVSSLSAGEMVVEPGAPDPVAPVLPAPERAQPPRAAPHARAEPMDPRRGCENMNFIFAARCEASHCDNPAYSRHPRCDRVREERRRDEARRNPTLGY